MIILLFVAFFLVTFALASAEDNVEAQVFGDDYDEASMEFVNANNVAVEVVHKPLGSNQWFVRHRLEPYQTHGWHGKEGDEWCAQSTAAFFPYSVKSSAEPKRYGCQTTTVLFPRVMVFSAPEDQCGFDLGDLIQLCTVPEHRGQRHVRINMLEARKSSAILRRESVELERVVAEAEDPWRMPKYTELGYKKSRMPEKVWRALRRFYTENWHRAVPEVWPTSATVVNHWESSRPLMIHLPHDMKQLLFNTLKPMLSEWTGKAVEDMEPVSCYGIRTYRNGSYLRNHVDTLSTHHISSIVHIDHDIDEEWPLEVVGHDGKMRRHTMEPGDLVYYESSRVIHGRPSILKGRTYTNCFVHFTDITWEIPPRGNH